MRAQDFGVSEFWPRLKVLFGVQADGDAVCSTATTSRALGSAGLADFLHRQALHLRAVGVARDAGVSGIHHIVNAGDGQRGFGNVGGQHDASVATGGEDPVLLRIGEPAEQREDIDVPALAGECCLQGIGCIADFPLAGEETQDVAGSGADQLLARLHQPVQGIHLGFDDLAGFLVEVLADQRPIPYLYGVGTAGDLDDGGGLAIGIGEVFRECLGVDRGRGDDELEIRALWQQLLEVAQQEVDVQAALVGLIDDERVIIAQFAIALNLVEQYAVCHQLDGRGRADVVVEADLVAHQRLVFLAGFAQLVGNTVGHTAGSEASGLGMANYLTAAAPQLQAHFRNLGGLTGTRFASDDDHLVLADGPHDLFPAFADRQLLGEVDGADASLNARTVALPLVWRVWRAWRTAATLLPAMTSLLAGVAVMCLIAAAGGTHCGNSNKWAAQFFILPGELFAPVYYFPSKTVHKKKASDRRGHARCTYNRTLIHGGGRSTKHPIQLCFLQKDLLRGPGCHWWRRAVELPGNRTSRSRSPRLVAGGQGHGGHDG